MDYKTICEQVCSLSRETGKFILSEVEKIKTENVEIKGKHNFVTYVDKTSEARIVERLQQILPEAGFIAEEGTSSRRGEKFNWVIDPLDGTTNFIHGLPPFSISIALTEGPEVVVGVVYEIMLGECFYAWKGGKAFVNGREISVTAIDKVDDSLIATGFPYSEFDVLKPFMGTLAYLMQHSHGVRRLGSAATDLAYVACGRFEGFYEWNLNPWDVAAGALIVQQAGGKVTDFSGGTNYVFGKEIVASNGCIHDEFRRVINEYSK
jgi:myo-inositol-1(or 4)-monophosphatase